MLFIKTFMKWFDHEIGLDRLDQELDLNLKTSDLSLDKVDAK